MNLRIVPTVAVTETTPQEVPFHGSLVSCGLFGISDDYIEKFLSLDQKFLKNKATTFLFKAQSDSMSPLILPGDILIVDRAQELLSGKIIVASFEGGLVCKRYILAQGQPLLRSENPTHKDYVISEESQLILFGVVTGIAREFF